MNKQIIAQDVADHLGEAEMAIAQSLAKTAKLLEAMVIAQSQLRLSAVAVDPVMRRVTNALGTLGQAHAELTSAHNRMDQMQKRMDIRPVAAGGLDKDDNDPDVPPHGAFDTPVTARELQL